MEEEKRTTFQQTLPFLKEAGKHIAKTGFGVFMMMALFVATNLVFVTYGCFTYFTKEETTRESSIYLVVMLVVAVLSTLFAFAKMYKGAFMDTVALYFNKMDAFKNRIAEKIIDAYYAGKVKIGGSAKIGTIINAKEVATEVYGHVPGRVQKIFSFILNRIPMAEFLTAIKTDLDANNREKAVVHFTNELNRYFEESVFDRTYKRTVYLVLLMAVALHVVAIYYLS